MQPFIKLIILFLLLLTRLQGQNSEIKTRPDTGELEMTFPSIYFKHNSTDYATMPYTVDSCFKYIAVNFDENINSLVVWRDSLETEKLTKQRIKKLQTALSKNKETRNVFIESMEQEQKISRYTINQTSDSLRIKYLLTLNSVFDFSKTRPQKKISQDHHGIWIFGTCWKHAFHLNKMGRDRCRWDRRRHKNPLKKNKFPV